MGKMKSLFIWARMLNSQKEEKLGPRQPAAQPDIFYKPGNALAKTEMTRERSECYFYSE